MKRIPYIPVFLAVVLAFGLSVSIARAASLTGEEEKPAAAECKGDSDCDGLLDADEGDLDGDGELGPNESDPNVADTDGDGVTDGDERRAGTKANTCDTDEDGLSDGVEMGKIQPVDKDDCHGLQAAGTNYRKPHVMDALNPDSDGDGLSDGEEDANGNGWVDPEESDPSVEDTDGDGLSDGVEALGDFDSDGIPDFDFRLIKAGQKCSPPANINDVDCDGMPNAIDTDSDNDGCIDALEGGWMDANANGIPDIYDNQAKQCPEEAESGGGGGRGARTEEKDKPSKWAATATPIAGYDDGGCALTGGGRPATRLSGALAILLICAVLCISSIIARWMLSKTDS